ncbi:MAG: hypothetical protein K2X35_00115 [Bryobacteraceae bacterium]|nr:hypothetical protein [Bryobacteraceae bacterium]
MNSLTARVREASATCRLTYDRMLPALPLPGTALFTQFLDLLQPIGLKSAGVGMEGNPQQLDDCFVRFSLGDDQLRVKIGYQVLEVSAKLLTAESFGQADDLLPELTRLVSTASKGTTERLQLDYLAHAQVLHSSVRQYLSERLPSADGMLIADALAYCFDRTNSGGGYGRVVIASSILFDNAVFVDCILFRGLASVPLDLNDIRAEVQAILHASGLSLEDEAS